jgi:hypothetical protein
MFRYTMKLNRQVFNHLRVLDLSCIVSIETWEVAVPFQTYKKPHLEPRIIRPDTLNHLDIFFTFQLILPPIRRTGYVYVFVSLA